MTFKKWTSIPNFRNFYTDLVRYKSVIDNDYDMNFTFDGKVKLHGTNASITISNGNFIGGKRTSYVTVDDDNLGFAKWVETIKPRMNAMTKSTLASKMFDETRIYGEWIGPGVQKGVAASNIEKKYFAVFSVNMPNWENEIAYSNDHSPWNMVKILFEDIDDVIFIEVFEKAKGVSVNFDDKENTIAFQDKINSIVNEVCACDPFIKETFNIEGPGEGLVFYSRRDVNGSRHLFKAKGEAFAESKQKTPMEVDYEKVNSLTELAENICPDHRLEKKFDEFNFPLDIRNVGGYIKLVCTDVHNECVNEITESGFEWKEVARYVTKRASEFYRNKLYII